MRVADGGDYPHKFGIVGYNDDTKEIAYLWFYDTDFDYIASFCKKSYRQVVLFILIIKYLKN